MLNVPGFVYGPREQLVTILPTSSCGRAGRRFDYLLRFACVFTTFLSFVSLGMSSNRHEACR